MDFDFTDDQRALADTVRHFLARQYTFEQRRERIARASSGDRSMWTALADLGLLALPFAADDGGLGGTGIETMLMMEAFGGALVVEPYIAGIVLAGGVIAAAGDDAQRAALLPGVMAGQTRIALAHAERDARDVTSFVATRAREDADGFVIDGHKHVVPGGADADTLIVTARVAGGAVDDSDGIALFVVPLDAAGVSRHAYRTHDDHAAADMRFTGVRVDRGARLVRGGDAFAVLQAAIDRAGAALVAESVGILQRLVDTTLEHLKTRRQFGQPIGRFQALQHRMVDMLVATEQSRSMMFLAAMHADDPDPVARAHAIAGARAYVARAAREVAHEAVQLHGGMGLVDEHVVAHAFKRLAMIGVTLGDADAHLARYADGLRAA